MLEWLFLIVILIFSAVLHEVAHGAMAYRLGDPTAKYMGRLTINPLKHLDLFGSIIMPFFLVLLKSPVLFGYAKPVPINPYNFRDQKWGSAKVAFAGRAVNLMVALCFGLISRTFSFLPAFPGQPAIYVMFSYIVYINILLAVFNLLPIPPLDGSHILFSFLPSGAEEIKIGLSRFGIFILLFIIFFFPHQLFFLINFIFHLIMGSSLGSLG